MPSVRLGRYRTRSGSSSSCRSRSSPLPATLEEVVEAKCLLHVVDNSDPHAWDQIDVVGNAGRSYATRIPKILILNKIDR